MDPADEEDNTYRQYDIHEGVIFLIELSEAIYTPIKELNGHSQLVEILSSINQLMQELIITLPNTGVGIYFYNSDKVYKKFASKSNLTRLFRLNDLNSTNMKTLNDLLEDDSKGTVVIRDKFKPTEKGLDNELPLVLNSILDEFHSTKTKYNVKKLLWFTNNEQPFKSDAIKQNLWKTINDFEEFRINITPIFLDTFEDEDQKLVRKFNLDLYREIFLNTSFMNTQDSTQETQSNLTWRIMQSRLKETTLSNRIKTQILRLKEIKRIQFACDLVLSEGAGVGGKLGCSIRGFTLYNHEKIKKFRHLYTKGENLQLVELTSKLNNESGDQVTVPLAKDKSLNERKDEAGLKSGVSLGGDTIFYLNSNQIDYLRTFAFDHEPDIDAQEDINDDNDADDNEEDEKPQEVPFSKPPYLKLLGFRHISKFKPYYTINPPVFVTADLRNGLSASSEGGYDNSLQTFSSLYRSCSKLERFAILFGCIKRNSLPNLYAFYPTRLAKSTKGGDLELPQGFLLIRLPWLDDIRSLPDHMISNESNQFDKFEANTNPSSLVSDFKSLISQFFLDRYNPGDYPNPSLNYFYKIIKSDLLQLSIDESYKNLSSNDETYKSLKELRDFLSNDVQKVSLLQVINSKLGKYDNLDVVKKFNRETEPETKKQKVAELTDEAVLTAWKTSDWGHFTVAQLRRFISSYKPRIKAGTKKQDMIDNICEYLESRENQ